jgi:hypothetical protein
MSYKLKSKKKLFGYANAVKRTTSMEIKEWFLVRH